MRAVVVLLLLSAAIGAQSVRELLRQAKSEHSAGRIVEAQALLRSALALAEDSDDEAAVYAACRSLIAIHDADDRQDLAAPLWERVVEILKRDPARDGRDGGAAHEAWIGALREAGRDGDIGRAAESGAAWAKRHPEIAGSAALRFAVARARAAIAARRFDEAEALIDAADDLVEGLSEADGAAADRMLVGGLAARLSLAEGRAAEALARADVATKGKLDRPSEAAIVRALALLGLGRLDEAVAAADTFSDERAQAVIGSAPFVEGCLEAARIHFECGRLDKAIVVLERAQAVVDRDSAIPFALRRATIAQTVGALTGLGRPEEALARLEAAGPVIERLKSPRSIGDYIVLRQMVTARLAAGQDAPAHASAEVAVAFALDRFGRSRAETADALALLAVCCHQGGELPNAIRLYEEALSIARRAEPGGGRLTAVVLGNLAGALRAGDRTNDAVARYDEALAMARDTAPGEIPNLAAKYGRLLLNERKDAKAAREAFEVAIEALETLHERALGLSEADRGSFLDAANRFRAYDGLAHAHAALGEFESAVAALERGRGRMLLDLVGRLRFDPLANVLARAESSGDTGLAEAARRVGSKRNEAARELEAAQSALDRMRSSGSSAEAGDQPKAAARLREAYAHSRAAVREAAALTAREVEIGATADIASIRRKLEGDDRILWYSITDFDAWAFAIGKHPRDAVGFRLTDIGKSPVTRAILRTEVARYRRFLARAPEGDVRASVALGIALGTGLADILLPSELRRVLAGASTIYLVPHEALNDLVFETLPLPDANGGRTPWIDAMPPISYVPSGSVLNWLLGRERTRQGTEPQYSLVAVGDPDFRGASATSRPDSGPTSAPVERSGASLIDLVSLPGSRREAVAATLAAGRDGSKTLLLLGPEATESAVFAAAPKARFLHLATHQVMPVRHDASWNFLALSPSSVPTPDDDGRLSLGDLIDRWRNRLASLRLVTLSACETQRGESTADYGTFALPWGFLFAGAPAVIASHWRVSDDATAELMSTFYEILAKEPAKRKLDAFTEARRAVRQRRPHPYQWAPFIFLGEP